MCTLARPPAAHNDIAGGPRLMSIGAPRTMDDPHECEHSALRCATFFEWLYRAKAQWHHSWNGGLRECVFLHLERVAGNLPSRMRTLPSRTHCCLPRMLPCLLEREICLLERVVAFREYCIPGMQCFQNAFFVFLEVLEKLLSGFREAPERFPRGS